MVKTKTKERLIQNNGLRIGQKEEEIRKAELITANEELENRIIERMSSMQESQERLNFFIDNINDYAIIFFDINGNVTKWNSGAQRILLYNSNEIIGKNFSLFFTETDRASNKPLHLLSLAKSNKHVEDEGWRVKKDGKLFWEALTIISLIKNNGTHYGYVNISHDLTERKLAEEEISKLNQSLEHKIERTKKLSKEINLVNQELIFENQEKEKRAAKLVIANKELAFQNEEKEKRAAELIIANKELAFQNQEKEKRAAELIIANKELAFQNQEKEKRAAELIIANNELVFQNQEKEKRASELIIANKELIFQNQEKEKRAEELIIANKELIFQNEEKVKRAAELIIANIELNYQNEEKVKRAAELIAADKELIYQNEEKGKRAAELIVADKELVFQTEEKVKRAEELIIANIELDYQNEEKVKRAEELVIANIERDYQNEEKVKRAEELIIANKELVFQTEEKEKRAAELIIADIELDFQNEEKEKREAANKELEAFSYSVSHDLRAPLRHIGGFVDLLIKNNSSQLDSTGLRYLNTILESSRDMGNLIDALLTFSRLGRAELQRTIINTRNMVTRLLKSFSDELDGRNIEINIAELPEIKGDENLINQVWVNLISNALKYSRKKEKAVIDIGSIREDDKIIYHITDNGAGFDMKYSDKLFGVFQRLHKTRDFEGIGIGLANVNRIVTRHGGKCWATAEVDKGATFFFSIPTN